MAQGGPPVQPNQWLFGAPLQDGGYFGPFILAGPYPLPPFPIVNPLPPITADDLGVTFGNALGLANAVDNLGVLT
jgi:hypothetical protein